MAQEISLRTLPEELGSQPSACDEGDSACPRNTGALPGMVRSVQFLRLPYAFTNDRNETVHLSEWRGKPLIVTMEYSNCRFMCTTTFSKMKAIQAAG